MRLKVCTKCRKLLAFSNFTSDKRHLDGKQSSCTKCRSADNSRRKQRYLEDKRCVWCGLSNDREQQTCTTCELNRLENYRLLKLEIFNHYGGAVCACCGEKEFLFLTLDHINNDGAKQRKELNALGKKFYLYVKRVGFPEDLQVLCMNCNFAKGVYGGCPHKNQK